jgi:regulator of sigma E protease
MLHFAETLLLYVVPFLFVLGLVVTVHEMGHFLAAKACGVAIDRFSIGFGKAIFAWRDKSGVEWQVAWLPLGGYVRFAGDDTAASVPDQDDLQALRRAVLAQEGPQALRRYYHFKPVWQRAIVAAAGPVANFILAVVIFALLLMVVGDKVSPARVDQLAPGQPAAKAGFMLGDVIERADGTAIGGFEDLQRYVVMRAGLPIHFTVQRAGREIDLTAMPILEETQEFGLKEKIGRLGIGSIPHPGDIKYRRYSLLQAIPGGAAETWDVLHTTLFTLGRLIHGQVPADQLQGPLGIAQASGAIAHAGAQGAPNLHMAIFGGIISLLGLAAIMSVSIGFMNLLPVPMLDGGHLLFYAYEAAARRPVGARVQAAGYRVGLALLLGLMLFATWNDLQRLRVFQILGGLFS